MSQLGEDVGAMATGHSLTWKGRRVEFRHLGIVELAEYERLNFEDKRNHLRQFREDYSQEAYEARLDQLRAQYDANEMTLQADYFGVNPEAPSAKTFDSTIRVLRVMTGLSAVEVAQLITDEGDEALRLFRLVMAESFPRRADPNPQAAGKPN